jgi:deoxyribonuclease V
MREPPDDPLREPPVAAPPDPAWDVSVAEARDIQRRLRSRLVLEPPPGFAPATIGGADMSISKFAEHGFGGIVVLDAATLETVEEAGERVRVSFPYVPGLLSFRELPALLTVWERLARKPDVLLFDGQGLAHPRRFGIACHGGLTLGVPTVGCAKSILVGRHGPLADDRGATAELVDRGEVVGVALRTRAGTKPLYVSPGHLMDLPTAVALVMRVVTKYREPETTRRSHQLVNRLRREAGE